MQFITGFGARDSHSPVLSTGEVNKSPRAGQPYQRVSLDAIVAMLQNPAQVDKADGQWIIPSSYHQHDARSHSTQREHGAFHALVVDIDKGNPSIEQVQHSLNTVLGAEVWCAIWSTPSSTEGLKKWRVLIPLAEALAGKQYSAFQAALFDGLEMTGLDIDRSLERPAQVLYLPNRGQFYQYAVQGSHLLAPLGHGMAQRAQQYIAMLEAETKHSTEADTEGPRSHLRAFRYKHSIDDLLAAYGFECHPTNPDLWRHPSQSNPNYGSVRIMRYPEADRWVSLSDTVNQLGIGRATPGGRSGDAFDLYLYYTAQNNLEAATAYAKICLSEEDDKRYGCATTKHIMDMWCSTALYANNVPLNGIAMELHQQRILSDAKADQEVVAQALRQTEEEKRTEWGGDWLNDVPSNLDVKPDVLEWASWHAPGMIGEIVRAKAGNLQRHTLVPAMMGAVAAIAYLGQGKYVSIWNEHVTPSALLMYVVGPSGSGKTDANDTFYEVKRLVDEKKTRAKMIDQLSSGPALVSLMAENDNPHLFIIQEEAGALRDAGQGDKNHDSLVAQVTKLFTSFKNGTAGSYGKTTGHTVPLKNPTLGGLFNSTPEKLFSTISNSDAESGWLGRNMFIEMKHTVSNMDRRPVVYPDHLVDRLNAVFGIIPPIPGQIGSDFWTSGDGETFHRKHYSQETIEFLRQSQAICDGKAGDLRRSARERALFNRANEMVNRLTFVAGLACGYGPVPVTCAQWAKLVVDEAVAFATRDLERMFSEDDSGPAAKIRFKIRSFFGRVQTDSKFRNTFKGGCMQSVDKDYMITLSGLKRKLKDNIDAPSGLINAEIESMVADEVLFQMPPDLSRKTWLRFLG